MKAVNFQNLSSSNPKVKFGFAKKLLAISQKNPQALYPYLNFFVSQLNNENQIIKWIAIQIIGNLSKVDKANKIDRLINKLVGLLNKGELITCNNAIIALGEIASNKPNQLEKITSALLQVEHYRYPTKECRNIAMGKVMLEVCGFYDNLKNKKPVIDFVKRQTNNSRNATRKKAREFLKSKIKI